jgi:hypothetical protein
MGAKGVFIISILSQWKQRKSDCFYSISLSKIWIWALVSSETSKNEQKDIHLVTVCNIPGFRVTKKYEFFKNFPTSVWSMYSLGLPESKPANKTLHAYRIECRCMCWGSLVGLGFCVGVYKSVANLLSNSLWIHLQSLLNSLLNLPIEYLSNHPWVLSDLFSNPPFWKSFSNLFPNPPFEYVLGLFSIPHNPVLELVSNLCSNSPSMFLKFRNSNS